MPRLVHLTFHPDPQSTSLGIMALMIDVGFRAFHVFPCWSERASLDLLPVRHRVDSRLFAIPGPCLTASLVSQYSSAKRALGSLNSESKSSAPHWATPSRLRSTRCCVAARKHCLTCRTSRPPRDRDSDPTNTAAFSFPLERRTGASCNLSPELAGGRECCGCALFGT